MVWQVGGPLLLLSALRWKLPEGRLLLALSLVPHNLIFYDQFLLFLVCKKGRETLALVVLGWAAGWIFSSMWPTYGGPETAEIQKLFRFPVVACLYLPALYIVLRQKNPDRFSMTPLDDDVGVKF
jgi:hypothetical protein